jgi:hypothetical protein
MSLTHQLHCPIARPASLVTFASLSDSRRKGRRGDRLDDVVDLHLVDVIYAGPLRQCKRQVLLER